MIGKQHFIIILLVLFSLNGLAQSVTSFGTGGITPIGENMGEPGEENEGSHEGHDHEEKEKHIPSIMRAWQLSNYAANFEKSALDTALGFFNVYNPVFKNDIYPVFTGNNGGAYESSDFFNRNSQTGFYFYKSFEVYSKFPQSLQFLNTTTPYTLLDYSQSENKNERTETRFNVFHSQNASKDFNFQLFYDQSKSTGHYQYQEAKYHDIGLATSYISDKFNSHAGIIFNRIKGEENGGLQPDQDLDEYEETETFLVNLVTANSQIKNNTFWFANEYKLGKYEEKEDSTGAVYDQFRPITGIIHSFEYSGNRRLYTDTDPDTTFYRNTYRDDTYTGDTAIYNRMTNVFQLKFYESADRKYTFSKRAYIGNDLITAKMMATDTTLLTKERLHNTFVGGAISHDLSEFWRWNMEGKIYLTGYRAGQTELSAFIFKPLRIGKDTTSFYLKGELNTIVPDYFQQQYRSNHYEWNNNFDNMNEMIVRARIQSQRHKLTLGFNYALIGNYIYNNELALPTKAGSEMLVLGAYLNKDIESKHWLLRANLLWQQTNQESYLHLPQFSGYLSVNFKLLISKVLHANFGTDVRYSTAYYGDAYDPATGQYYWQNQQKIGNFPIIDLHANLKLKRTRAFFQLMNAATGILDGNYWVAPDYPLYRRTFRLGIAWSFYD
ncbi:MAG: putative porin [Mangrovibacterium sp.]